MHLVARSEQPVSFGIWKLRPERRAVPLVRDTLSSATLDGNQLLFCMDGRHADRHGRFVPLIELRHSARGSIRCPLPRRRIPATVFSPAGMCRR